MKDVIEKLLPKVEERLPSARSLYLRLKSLSMEGTFQKYLQGANLETLLTFFEELGRVDWQWVARHREALLGEKAKGPVPDLEPIEPDTLDKDVSLYLSEGERSLRNGEWAVVVLAGGAATRFFSEAHRHEKAKALIARYGVEPPKGLFPITPVKGYSFLDLFAAETLATGVKYGRMPFLILLVSEVTEGPISAWLATSDLFGFPKAFILPLRQAVHPRLDLDGDLVVQEDGHLLWTGDGHGGVFRALLQRSEEGQSLAECLLAKGTLSIVVHNVDNALAKALEPTRLGYHRVSKARMTLSVTPRARIDEKVGLVARDRRSGRIEVLEYSVFERSQVLRPLAEALDELGRPLLRLAHICTNLVDLSAIREDIPPTLYTGKRIKVGDREVETSTFEMLNQHLAPLLGPKEVAVLLVERDSYFLPTKYLTGPDSYETTVAGLTRLYRGRLRKAFALVDETAIVEIPPFLDDLERAGAGQGWVIGPRSKVYLGVRHGIEGLPPFSEDLFVGEGATFVIEARRPYGNLKVDEAFGTVTEDPKSAGKVRIGKGLRIEPGAGLEVTLEGSGCLIVPDSARISRPIKIFVRDKEVVNLSGFSIE